MLPNTSIRRRRVMLKCHQHARPNQPNQLYSTRSVSLIQMPSHPSRPPSLSVECCSHVCTVSRTAILATSVCQAPTPCPAIKPLRAGPTSRGISFRLVDQILVLLRSHEGARRFETAGASQTALTPETWKFPDDFTVFLDIAELAASLQGL